MPWQAYLDMHSSFSIPLNVPSNDVSVAEGVLTFTKAEDKTGMEFYSLLDILASIGCAKIDRDKLHVTFEQFVIVDTKKESVYSIKKSFLQKNWQH